MCDCQTRFCFALKMFLDHKCFLKLKTCKQVLEVGSSFALVLHRSGNVGLILITNALQQVTVYSTIKLKSTHYAPFYKM